jgi:hypothetical protein
VLALSASGVNASNLWEVPRGIQSVSVSTNFGLEQVFQQGQQAIYENSETVPEIEVTVNRILDATMPLYLIASASTGASLSSPGLGLSARVSEYQCNIALHIYPEAVLRASGVADARMMASGAFMTSINYTFPVDAPATEEASFACNNKFWSVPNGGTAPQNHFPSGGTTSIIPAVEDATTQGWDDPTTSVENRKVTRREDVDLAASTFPTEIPSDDRNAIQNITVSCDLGREEIFALGSKAAYTRTVQFPIEVTCTFECLTSVGDKIQALSTVNNLANRTITLKTKQGLVLELGTKNKLASIEFSGGDTSGGNVTVTYNYTNFNDLVIYHSGFKGQ